MKEKTCFLFYKNLSLCISYPSNMDDLLYMKYGTV